MLQLKCFTKDDYSDAAVQCHSTVDIFVAMTLDKGITSTPNMWPCNQKFIVGDFTG